MKNVTEALFFCLSTALRHCPATMFECHDGWSQFPGLVYKKCIEQSRICDGVIDCNMDQKDEEDCPCKENEFQCVSNGMCIPKGLRCDHDRDCMDYSDELNCSKLDKILV
jgi:hypothetical protein